MFKLKRLVKDAKEKAASAAASSSESFPKPSAPDDGRLAPNAPGAQPAAASREEAEQQKVDSATRKRAQELADLANVYASDGRNAKFCRRSKPDPIDAVFADRLTAELNQAYGTLKELQEPLKLFGETPQHIIDRALKLRRNRNRSKMSQFVYPSLSDIPLNTPELADENDVVLAFISTVANMWKARIESEGARRFFETTQEDLRPLVRKLETRSLDGEIRSKLAELSVRCVRKEYIKAHDCYIGLAIGSAAWPMGVTMVGIHERVGRSKIASSEIAHILNDETTRKFIQMVKRLITVCQNLMPTDPSRMVAISETTNLF